MQFIRNRTSPYLCRRRTPPARKISSPESGKILELDEEDLFYLTKNWENVKDPNAFACEVFRKIVTSKPSLAVTFLVDVNDIEKGNLPPHFRDHAGNFASFISNLIKIVNDSMDMDSIIPRCRDMGRLHAGMGRKVSFDAENWLLFKSAFLEEMCPNVEQGIGAAKPQYVAWHKFLMFVISEVKDAFHCALLKPKDSLSDISLDEFSDQFFAVTIDATEM